MYIEKLPLTIILVVYNEKDNIPKFLDGLKNLEDVFVTRKIIVDQESTDGTFEILKGLSDIELYKHPNRGYPDPDKARVVNTKCKKDERCIILDCDEIVTKELSKKIKDIIIEGKYDVVRLNIENFIRGISMGASTFPRLFKPLGVNVDDVVHDYVKIVADENKILKLKNPKIIAEDLKYKGKEISVLYQKMNKYIDMELSQKDKTLNEILIGFLKIFTIEIVYIFIYQGLLFKGIKGIIIGLMLTVNNIVTYSRYYEKFLSKNN